MKILTNSGHGNPVKRGFTGENSSEAYYLRKTYPDAYPSQTKETGNLWTNPERSCLHADPAIDLKNGETKTLELKTFIVEAMLSQLLNRIKKEM